MSISRRLLRPVHGFHWRESRTVHAIHGLHWRHMGCYCGGLSAEPVLLRHTFSIAKRILLSENKHMYQCPSVWCSDVMRASHVWVDTNRLSEPVTSKDKHGEGSPSTPLLQASERQILGVTSAVKSFVGRKMAVFIVTHSMRQKSAPDDSSVNVVSYWHVTRPSKN